MWSGCTLGGALGLVVHDAAVGIQGERETAAKPLHGLVEGREPKHDRDDAHLVDQTATQRRWLCSSLDCCRAAKIRGNTRGTLAQPPRVVCWLVGARGT